MKLLFKTKGAKILVNASTNRKTCTTCRGRGELNTDEEYEPCNYCGGSGKFLHELIHDNFTHVTKYFSKHDIEKLILIRKVHEYSHAYEMETYYNCSREQYPNPPEEKNMEVIVVDENFDWEKENKVVFYA